jgi:drug/metabolite transporter (DMT)-like permease
MLPATCLGGLVMAAVGGIFADNLIISNHDLVIALLMGTLQFGIGFFCFTIATRYILASEVALFALTESILGPIWVWIGVGEQPSLLTIAGSGIVLVCVSAYCIAGIRQERRKILDSG